MRVKHSFRRARRGDPEAKAKLAKHYAYLASPETVEAALDGFDGGLGEFATHIRWLAANPPSREPTAAARIDPQEWAKGSVLAYRTNPKKATETEQEEETSRPEVEAVSSPAPEPFAVPNSAPALSTTTATLDREPLVLSPEPTRPAPKPPALAVRRARPPETATSALPAGAYRRIVDVALSVAPKWQWPLYDCLHIQIADGEVVVFARSDSTASWVRLEAATAGRATAAIPRPGAAMLRRVQGKGPVSLEIHADRVTIRRDSDPISVPAREGVVPRVPEIEVRGGLVVARETLAPALDIGRDEVLLSWDGHGLQVGDTPVEVRYGSSQPWTARLDPRLLLSAVVRGSDPMTTLEVPTQPDAPIIVTSGVVTCAIAQRCPSYL